MDYEKNKTIAIMKQMVADGKITQSDAEKYCPEIAKSEDEKIRNTIFECLYKCCDSGVITREQRKKCIDWLEKQCEQKPADWSEVLRYEVNDSFATITKCPHEQKSSIVDGVAFVGSLSCGRCPFYGGKAGSRGIYCKYKEKQGEQKPADWSEEDTKWAEEIRLALRLYSKDKLYVERLTNWFNNHVQPQTKQEWSEEERDIITGIIRFLQTLASRNDNQTFYSSTLNQPS